MTADRLLAGELAPDALPLGYEGVATALQAAALMASEQPTGDEAMAVAAFRDAIPRRRIQRMTKWKVAAAALAGGLTLSTGLAAADVLPDVAQDVASEALAKVGINVPGSDNKGSEKNSNVRAGDVDEDSPTTTKPDNHGSVVSNVARDDGTDGADHGSAVCATASDGKCQPKGSNPSTNGQGSVNSTEGSANAGQGAANSGRTTTTASNTAGATAGGGANSSNSSSSGGSSNNSSTVSNGASSG